MTRRADEARRKNSKKSTGPRSVVGKRRVAQNAWRHGLSSSLQRDEREDARLKKLSELLLPSRRDDALQELGIILAQVQLELLRVRTLRLQLLQDPVATSPQLTSKGFMSLARSLSKGYSLDEAASFLVSDPAVETSPRPNLSLAEKISSLAHELSRLDRYERRALSRRKFLIRQFDALSSVKVGANE